MKIKPISSAICMTLLTTSMTSFAQVNEGAEKIEKIAVTGSRIKRTDMEAASPVSIITSDEILATGISNVENLLQEMSFSAGVAGNQTNAYWTSGGYGTAQVNLRGMGIKRTLVLLNGRRIVSGGTGANSSVDLNMIPTSIIKQIEVLKDGASAVYGADAVAGVVNIITKNNFEGAELDVKAGMADDGDGENQDISFSVGQNFEKGHFFVNATYSNSEAVRQSDRVDCPVFGTEDGTLQCFGSSTTEGGRALLADGTSVQFNQNPDTANFGNDFGPYNSEKHGFDWLPYLNAVSPLERFSISSFTNYQVNDSTSVFYEAMYTKRKAQQIVTPRNGFGGITVDADFRYNPTGQDVEFQRRRNTELGAPYFFQETDTFRVVLGLDGELNNGWYWEVAYNYGRNTGLDGWTFDIDPAKAQQTLDDSICTYDNSNGIPCGDWFGVNELTPQVIDYVRYRREGSGGNEMRTWTANISGDLFQLPAGYLAFAAGIEKRWEKGWRNPDSTVLANGLEDEISGQFDVSEAYAEFSVPLIENTWFAEKIDTEFALRYSDYDSLDAETTYKVGLTWKVNPELMLRSVRSTAFRAPVITEQYGGTNGENLRTIDPCENATGAIAQNCLADNVPANFVQDGTTVLTNVGGNPNVGPEEADTLTLGLVWQPQFVENLSMTIDYFDIDVEGAITSVNGSDMLRLCYEDPVGNSEFCGTFKRHPLTRQVIEINQRPVNAAEESVSGIDVNIQYQFALFGLNAKTSLDVTRLLKHESTPFAGQPTIDKVGYITEDQGSYTEWRSNFNFAVMADNWSSGVSVRYIGAADDVNGGDFDPLGKSVDAAYYTDIYGSYYINDNLQLSAGIDNLFDKKPPYLTSWNDANTDVMTYDLIGRRGFVRLNYKF